MDGKRGWKDHKEVCVKILTLSKKVAAVGQELVQEFGGTETFFKSPLFKKGLFDYIEEYDDAIEAKNTQEKYILARGRLIKAYVKCGKECNSSLAFRLAAVNMLDLLCFTFSNSRKGEHVRYTYGGWMVAGGMDQEALNYLCYFRRRKLSGVALPYLDLSLEEDVEGDYLNLFKTKKHMDDRSTIHWFHDYMLVALIKYKRLQVLMVQNKKARTGWDNFLMGTNLRVGEKSPVLKLMGKNLVLEKIKGLVLGEKRDQQVEQLVDQVKKLLTEVHQRNPLIIPGVLDDWSSIHMHEEDGDVIHDAYWAHRNYASARHMSPAYARVLKFWLNTGRVTGDYGENKKGLFPVEGFLQAAFDVDPGRFYGRKGDLFIENSSTWNPEYCDELLQTNHVSESSRQVVKIDKVSQNSEGQAENKTKKKKNRKKKVKIAAAALKTKTSNVEGMNIEVKSSSKDDKNDKEEKEKEKRLNKDVRLVEEKLSDHKARVEGIIANKAKEMRILIVKIDKSEDAKMQCGKKANEIDSMVSQLEDRIKTLINEKEELQTTLVQEEKKLKKNIDKKKRMEEFIDKKIKEEKTEQLKIEGRLQHLKDEMGKTKSKAEIKNDIQMPSTNVPFSNFIVDKIQEKEKELECPVCLVLASPPIFSCAKQHLVCKECRPRLKECPECRAPYLEVQRHRYAERCAEELETFKQQKRLLETTGVGE